MGKAEAVGLQLTDEAGSVMHVMERLPRTFSWDMSHCLSDSGDCKCWLSRSAVQAVQSLLTVPTSHASEILEARTLESDSSSRKGERVTRERSGGGREELGAARPFQLRGGDHQKGLRA